MCVRERERVCSLSSQVQLHCPLSGRVATVWVQFYYVPILLKADKTRRYLSSLLFVVFTQVSVDTQSVKDKFKCDKKYFSCLWRPIYPPKNIRLW